MLTGFAGRIAEIIDTILADAVLARFAGWITAILNALIIHTRVPDLTLRITDVYDTLARLAVVAAVAALSRLTTRANRIRIHETDLASGTGRLTNILFTGTSHTVLTQNALGCTRQVGDAVALSILQVPDITLAEGLHAVLNTNSTMLGATWVRLAGIGCGRIGGTASR